MIKRASLILLLNLILAAGGVTYAQTATPTLPFCATPNPATATPTPTYEDEILSLNPIAYWPLNETAGTIAIDATGNGRHGTYSGVTLNAGTFSDGQPFPSFDGINDNINITALGSAFNFNEGSLSLWYKVPSDSTWNDGTFDRVINIGGGGGNVRISKNNNSNALNIERSPNITRYGMTGTSWYHIALTWSVTANQTLLYINGALTNTTTANSITSSLTFAVIGAENTGGSNPTNGNIARVAIFNTPLSAGNIAELYTVPSSTPPTPTATPACVVYNPTATPTADVYNFWTLEPGTGGEGQAVAFEYRVDAGSFINAALLFVIALLIMAAIVMKRMNLL